MALRMSAELNRILESSTDKAEAFAKLFSGGVYEVYSGVQPPSADDPAQGMLLATTERTDASIEFVGKDGVARLAKEFHLQVSMQGELVARSGWFRLKANREQCHEGCEAISMDGSISEPIDGGDMVFNCTQMTNAMPLIMQHFSVEM